MLLQSIAVGYGSLGFERTLSAQGGPGPKWQTRKRMNTGQNSGWNVNMHTPWPHRSCRAGGQQRRQK